MVFLILVRRLIVVKINTVVRVCLIKVWRHYTEPFLSQSMEIKGSSLNVLDKNMVTAYLEHITF